MEELLTSAAVVGRREGGREREGERKGGQREGWREGEGEGIVSKVYMVHVVFKRTYSCLQHFSGVGRLYDIGPVQAVNAVHSEHPFLHAQRGFAPLHIHPVEVERKQTKIHDYSKSSKKIAFGKTLTSRTSISLQGSLFPLAVSCSHGAGWIYCMQIEDASHMT